MKGLMIALLTLLTASFAAAQQQGDDEGGTFILTLNGEQFANLINNPEGLVAVIPANANVNKVVVKLAKDVQVRENERVTTGKAGFPTGSAEVPALPQNQNVRTPSILPATQNGFRNSNLGVENSQSNITIPYAPPSQTANAIPSTPAPWIEFGDDSDFAPVVRRSQFIQPRQRANHLTDRDFGLGEIRQPDATTQRQNSREFVATPDFNRDTQFQNRDRSLDTARRDIGSVNPRAEIGLNNGVRPNTQTLQQMQRLENGIEVSKTMIANQDRKMNEQDRRINDLTYKLQQSQQRESRYVSALNNNGFAEAPNNLALEAPRQDRLARNQQTPVTTPRTTNVQNTRPEDQASTQDATHLTPPPSNKMLGDNQNLKKTNTFLLFMLLCSIGLNVYLGLIARSFYTRYAELADELRETFTATM